VASPFPYTTDFGVPEPPEPTSTPELRAESSMMDALSVTMPAAEAPPEARAALARLDAGGCGDLDRA